MSCVDCLKSILIMMHLSSDASTFNASLGAGVSHTLNVENGID